MNDAASDPNLNPFSGSSQASAEQIAAGRIDMHPVDPATIVIWRWETVVTVLILTVASFVPLLPMAPKLGFALAALVFLVGMIFAIWWPARRYRHLRYGLDEFGLVLQSGVWWRKQISLPRVRIQHTDVSQGPLQRRYGIATLKLYTAGSRYTKIELEGVQHAEALALRDSLVTRARSG